MIEKLQKLNIPPDITENIIRVFNNIKYDKISFEITNGNTLFISYYINNYIIDVDCYFCETDIDTFIDTFMFVWKGDTMITNHALNFNNLTTVGLI